MDRALSLLMTERLHYIKSNMEAKTVGRVAHPPRYIERRLVAFTYID